MTERSNHNWSLHHQIHLRALRCYIAPLGTELCPTLSYYPWSLTSLQQRLVKTGGRLVKHARYYWLLLAESHLTRRVFGAILRRIWALPGAARCLRNLPGLGSSRLALPRKGPGLLSRAY